MDQKPIPVVNVNPGEEVTSLVITFTHAPTSGYPWFNICLNIMTLYQGPSRVGSHPHIYLLIPGLYKKYNANIYCPCPQCAAQTTQTYTARAPNVLLRQHIHILPVPPVCYSDSIYSMCWHFGASSKSRVPSIFPLKRFQSIIILRLFSAPCSITIIMCISALHV